MRAEARQQGPDPQTLRLCPFCEEMRRRHPKADVVFGWYTAAGLERHVKQVHDWPVVP